LVVCVILAYSGFVWYSMTRLFRTEPERLASLQKLTEITHVTLPEGSVLLDGTVCPCWNAYLYARIRIPPHQLPKFWKQPPFNGAVSAIEDPMSINLPLPVRRRWGLDQVRDFRSSSGGDLHQGGVSQVLVSLDDPSNPLLHLYWFSG